MVSIQFSHPNGKYWDAQRFFSSTSKQNFPSDPKNQLHISLGLENLFLDVFFLSASPRKNEIFKNMDDLQAGGAYLVKLSGLWRDYGMDTGAKKKGPRPLSW